MTTTEKPAALLLAGELEYGCPFKESVERSAAAELRRLHAENERLTAALAATPAPVSALVPLTPSDREALRQRVMAEMDKRMPTITKKFHDWNGWPGTWTFADVAVSALQDHLIAHGIGQGKESGK